VKALSRREDRPPAQRQAAQQTVARQILVLIDQSQPQSLGLELARVYGMERLSSRSIALLGVRAELFRIRSGRSDSAVLAAVQRDTRIRSAQFNIRYSHSGEGSKSAGIPQYGPRNVKAYDAHKLSLGRDVIVAVIDSGVDTKHPDLKGAIVSSFDAAGGKDAGPDFHGTAVAGIIRARGIVEGVAPQAKIMAVRAFRVAARGAPPQTSSDVLLTAVDWAVANGARVLNLSFVGPRDPAVEALLAAAQQKRVVVVAAAGNGGPWAAPAYPAAYAGVIAVTAVDEADRRYKHANRGTYIAVAAPGVDILAPVERGGHSFLSGTSFAAAYVSGIAALLLERDGNLDPAALATLIASGADDLGPAGRDEDFGAGRVNALSSLQAMAPGLATKQ
jgi:subtilisin family serine protease